MLFAMLSFVATTCGDDVLHPARLFAVALALGFVVGPIVQAATGYYALPDGAERQRADLNRATLTILAGAALGMLTMRAALGREWRTSLRSAVPARISRQASAAGFGVAVTGVVILAAYLLVSGLSSVSLQGRGASYAVIPHEGRKAYLGLLAPIGLGGFFVIAARALERRLSLRFVLAGSAALVVGALMALPGSRANFLYAVAPLFFLYVGYRGFPSRRWLIVAAALLLVALTYGTSLRTAPVRSELIHNPWRTLLDNRPTAASIKRLFVVDVAHTEPLLGAMDAYPATRPFLGGESAAIGFTGPAGWKFARSIGLRIDPPAGVTLTAVAYGRDPSTFGAGLTATLPGELYANAGVSGVLVGLTAFGAIAGLIRRRAIHSTASGALVLYSVEITMLFAIFADYFGQFYRVGIILVGVATSLIVGGERRLAFTRTAAIIGVIVATAATLLVIHRFLGDPPAAAMTSNVPVYVALAALGGYLGIRANRYLRWIYRSD